MEITISFSSKKEYNKFLRNYRNGKGTNISQKNVDIDVDGEGFGDFVRGVSNVGKKIGSTAYNVAKTPVGKALLKEGVKAGQSAAMMGLMSRGVDPNTAYALTSTGSNLANQGVDGMGFLSNLKSGAKSMASSNLGKTIMKEGVKLGSNMAKNELANRGYNGPISNTLVDFGSQLSNQQINSMGQGFGGDGLSQSVNNMNQLRMKHARSFRNASGGSFRLP